MATYDSLGRWADEHQDQLLTSLRQTRDYWKDALAEFGSPVRALATEQVAQWEKIIRDLTNIVNDLPEEG